MYTVQINELRRFHSRPLFEVILLLTNSMYYFIKVTVVERVSNLNVSMTVHMNNNSDVPALEALCGTLVGADNNLTLDISVGYGKLLYIHIT